MRGLREYITNQNKDQLESAIHLLKEDLEFDSVAINQLHLAIYLFQDAVSTFFLYMNSISYILLNYIKIHYRDAFLKL